MHSILLVIKNPPADDSEKTGKWLQLSETCARAAMPNKGYDLLSAGTFLIHTDEGLHFLGLAICQAKQDGLQYRVLFFDESSELPKLTIS
jgi:hypothetical protein